jgi:hypothetical protein
MQAGNQQTNGLDENEALSFFFTICMPSFPTYFATMRLLYFIQQGEEGGFSGRAHIYIENRLFLYNIKAKKGGARKYDNDSIDRETDQLPTTSRTVCTKGMEMSPGSEVVFPIQTPRLTQLG